MKSKEWHDRVISKSSTAFKINIAFLILAGVLLVGTVIVSFFVILPLWAYFLLFGGALISALVAFMFASRASDILDDGMHQDTEDYYQALIASLQNRDQE